MVARNADATSDRRRKNVDTEGLGLRKKAAKAR
jgi:hypothetical protein